jgi:acetylornithine deacetylase
MLELLPALDKLDLPTDDVLGETTLNIGTLRAGTEANIIPAEAEAELMFRVVGDPAVVKKQVDKWAKGRGELEYGSYIPAQHFHTIPGFEVAPVAYTSDIPLLGKWGTPLLFGPGSIHVAHTPDEFIDVNELRAAVGAYERIVRSLLST